jgi:LPLT family lysophospholipid transporter-like MFS transporter
MAALIMVLALTDSIWPARAALLVIGMMGGMFIVPVNAILQELGKNSIGSGRAVALQGFFNNLAMLAGIGAFTLAASNGVDPVIAMLVLGLLAIAGITVLAQNLRRYPAVG